MNMVRRIGKVFLALLFLCLLAAPVVLLFLISEREQQQYRQATEIVLKDFAYGEICEVVRRDVEEEITVSGEVVSTEVVFIELNSYLYPYNIRLLVEPGEKLTVGDTIGYYQEEPILSDQTGIVKSVSIGTDSYILLESLENLALAVECSNENILDCFLGENVRMTTAEGAVFSVERVDDVKNKNGNTTVLLSCENQALTYGKQYASLRLQTGRVFPQALVVEKTCVYTLAGTEKQYVRRVDSNGEFMEEVEVSLGYSAGSFVCVSGIPEGSFCDGGYKAVIEGGGAG